MISVNGKLAIGQSFCRDGGTRISSCVATARVLLGAAMQSIERQEQAMRALVGVKRKKAKAPVKAWQRWTEEEDKQLIAMRNGNATLDEIAAELGRSAHTIKTRVAYMAGVAKKAGRPTPFILKCRPWPQEDKQLLVSMMGDKKSADEIAATLGRPRGAVWAMMKQIRQRMALHDGPRPI